MKPKTAIIILTIFAIIIAIIFLFLYKHNVSKTKQIVNEVMETKVIHKNVITEKQLHKINAEIKQKIESFTPEEKEQQLERQVDAQNLADEIDAEIKEKLIIPEEKKEQIERQVDAQNLADKIDAEIVEKLKTQE
jgi:hypothetical protein